MFQTGRKERSQFVTSGIVKGIAKLIENGEPHNMYFCLCFIISSSAILFSNPNNVENTDFKLCTFSREHLENVTSTIK